MTFLTWILLEVTSGNCCARAFQKAWAELKYNQRDILCQLPLISSSFEVRIND